MKCELLLRVRALGAVILMAGWVVISTACASPEASRPREDRKLQLVEIRHPWGPSTFAYRPAGTGPAFQGQ